VQASIERWKGLVVLASEEVVTLTKAGRRAARHDADQVTALMNQAVFEVRAGEPDDAFSQKAAKQVIRRIEW
jgi:hypothetical protein